MNKGMDKLGIRLTDTEEDLGYHAGTNSGLHVILIRRACGYVNENDTVV